MARYDIRRQNMVSRMADAMYDKAKDHLMRWCTLEMKDGTILKVVRTGYRSMEYFDRDRCELQDADGNILCKGENPYELAGWIYDHYCK